jgi:hypothetical protein
MATVTSKTKAEHDQKHMEKQSGKKSLPIDSHIEEFSKGIKSSEAKPTMYKNYPDKQVENMMHVETDAPHQDIFNHLKSMGYQKTQGYDPQPHSWTSHYNPESMITTTDPVHKEGVHAHISHEHGEKAKVHFHHTN